jgi:DUF438 domain-containing protein
MPAWVPVLVSVGLALGFAAIGFAFRTNGKLGDIKADIAVLQANTDVFWKVIGPHMSSIIEHPTELQRDHLVRMLDEGTIHYQEALQLNSMLSHALDAEKDNMMRLALSFKLAQVRVFLLKCDAARRKRQPTNEERRACL